VSIRPTIGLVVEGDTEYIAFPYLHTKKMLPNCPPLKATNLKGVGSHLNPEGVARMVAPKVIAHMAAGRNGVVVCIDLEDRNECPGVFAQAIHAKLKVLLHEKDYDVGNVHIIILNRSFEAILLAGSKGLHQKGLLKAEYGGHSFEGKLGKQGRKGVVELCRRPREEPREFIRKGFA
jgi:hypothetical protein